MKGQIQKTPGAITGNWRSLIVAVGVAVAAALAQAGGGATLVMPHAPQPVAQVKMAAAAQFRQKDSERLYPVPVMVELAPMVQERAGDGDDAQPLLQRTGVARDVEPTRDEAATAGLLQWQMRDDGRKLAALGFRSPEARGLRLGLQVSRLPPGTTVRLYRQDDADSRVLELAGSEILLAIQRNLNAGEDGAAARTYWMPDMGGDEVVLELELSAGVPVDSVGVAVAQISHLTQTAREATLRQAGSCNVDVSCVRSDAPAIMDSVARMEFVRNGNTYLCSGTLLNDSVNSETPYFLSAHHCIDSQTVASSMTTYWFYRSWVCNTDVLSDDAVMLTGGATLLYSDTTTNAAFMRLNTDAPQGAVFAGWYFMPLTNAASGTWVGRSVHHPQGDWQKYSWGVINGLANCPAAGSNGVSTCPQAAVGRPSNHFTVQWTLGTMEGGSRGAGLFISIRGEQLLVGQNSGGSASCNNPNGTDFFGQLELTYERGQLARWLDPSPEDLQRKAVYRFYNDSTGAHFFTASAEERDFVIDNYPDFQYEGTAFYAYGFRASNGGSGVHRFFHTELGTHFYTINEEERDAVLTHWPVYAYEGVAWFASDRAITGSSALYRFYLRSKGVHFYTISQAERDAIIRNWPEYEYEGVGYYAWTSR